MRRAVALAVSTVLAVAACSDPAGPPVVIPIPDADVILEPSRDNTLFADGAGGLSNGSGQFLFAGMTKDSLARRALLHFDVAGSAIPAGSTVDSVQLVLRMDRTIVGDVPVALHRMSVDWGEGASDAAFAEGAGAPSEAGDATWIHRFYDSELWAAPGGDFDTAPSATQVVGDEVTTYAWGSTAQMVADVRGWLDAPATNFGWILIADETTHTTAKRFGAREEAPSNRPKLRIFYTEP